MAKSKVAPSTISAKELLQKIHEQFSLLQETGWLSWPCTISKKKHDLDLIGDLALNLNPRRPRRSRRYWFIIKGLLPKIDELLQRYRGYSKTEILRFKTLLCFSFVCCSVAVGFYCWCAFVHESDIFLSGHLILSFVSSFMVALFQGEPWLLRAARSDGGPVGSCTTV